MKLKRGLYKLNLRFRVYHHSTYLDFQEITHQRLAQTQTELMLLICEFQLFSFHEKLYTKNIPQGHSKMVDNFCPDLRQGHSVKMLISQFAG
jgi:hypothetical protein